MRYVCRKADGDSCVLRHESRCSCSSLTWSAGVWPIGFSEESRSDGSSVNGGRSFPATVRENAITGLIHLDLIDGVGVVKEYLYKIGVLDGAKPYSLATA